MSNSRIGSAHPDRRSVVLAGSALLGMTALPGSGAIAQGASLAPASDFLGASRKFLATLEPESGARRRSSSMGANGGWNYFGATGFIKPGCGSSR
jgi:hypothetical protein